MTSMGLEFREDRGVALEWVRGISILKLTDGRCDAITLVRRAGLPY